MSKWIPKKPIGFHSCASITTHMFDKWFDEEIRPIFERACTVYGLNNFSRPDNWSCYKDTVHNHTALLINVELVKEDTPESILREIIEEYDKFSKHIDYDIKNPIVERARKLVENK